MRKFLGQNKRLVFTLIHKFRWDKGTPYPLLSDRRDIVVIVDEAHRTQYQSLAENMRAGLPKAQYLAFTGTPLLGTERKTNAWFGEYVSEYNFRQSVDDGATVPLFYSKRVPQISLQNENLDVEFCEIVEDENLTDAQRSRLENKYAAEISVLKNDDRLEAIAKDIVHHFPSRGYLGKGLIVSLDKFTAVKMFDKVQRLWKARIKELVGRSRKSKDEIEKDRIKNIVDYMRAVEMAVVVSEEADEEKLFRAQGLDITVHRQRMNAIDKHGHDLEYNFKDVPDHPVQLVFVCAMWLTGFDVPTLSTLYLDKPMQGHTLMQAIARANRVTSWRVNGVEKRNGEIIDYYNVFRDMKRALIDYAEGGKGEAAPVQNKTALFKLLDDAVAQGMTFCRDLGLHLDDLLAAKDVFKKIEIFEEYADRLLTKDEHRKSFAVYENTITGLYEACKPEILGKPVVRSVAIFQYLRGVVDGIIEQTDLAQVGKRVAGLLDESLVVDEAQAVRDAGGEFRIAQSGKAWDLSTLSVETLRKDFKETRHPHIEIADLRAFIRVKLEQMLKQNASRSSFAERLQRIVDTYNSGSSSADNSYEELLRFAKALKEEAERHLREELSEDELELFDLLKKEKMTKAEEQRVKLAARSLLERLTKGRPKVLVQDWYRDSMTKTAVRSAIEEVLDQNLPQESYNRMLFKRKCDTVYDLILEYASRGLKWAA
jgi:type I restriction enzyme R subunit